MTDQTEPEATRYGINELQKLNILLVEDDLLNAKLVSILFEQYGIKLQLAENGMMAVEKIKTAHFDIVLMDMEMPVMSGYEATALIRQQLQNNVPIIALTAHTLPGEKKKCMQLGMNDCISKPVNEAMLLRSIYNLTCNTPRLRKKAFTKRLKAPVVIDKVCKMDYLIAISSGNKKMINSIVTVFFKETRKELTCLNKAIKNTNYKVISDISHKIKSAFSILGISTLDKVFKEMELLSNIASPIEKIEQLNRRVNIVFKQAKAEMKTSG